MTQSCGGRLLGLRQLSLEVDGPDVVLAGQLGEHRQGHVANVVLVAMLAALLLRTLLLPVDGWLARLQVKKWSPAVRVGLGAGIFAVLVAGVFATGAAGAVSSSSTEAAAGNAASAIAAWPSADGCTAPP